MEWLLLIIIIPYFCYILRIRISLSGIKAYKWRKTEQVFISVIIACRNEQEHLPTLLESISKQDYPDSSYEVIIVDDNSTDNTSSIASGYKKIKNLNVLKNAGAGKKAAIRTGVASASGSLIITTDADCTMKEGWIGSIASFFGEKMPDLIICPVRLKGGNGFFQKFQELEFLSLQGITAGTAASGNPVMCNGANMAFTRETYNQNSDNLHEEIPSGDDVFLLHSVKRQADKEIMWLESEDSIVTTGTAPSLKAFLRQRTRWISKAGAYTDLHTRVLGAITFFAVLLQGVLLPASIPVPDLIPVFIAVFVLKSIPDFLILENTTRRYGSRRLLFWFLPSQLVYPYYILVVVFLQALKSQKG